jgi:nucleotide-binding universal stress UspA family protein
MIGSVTSKVLHAADRPVITSVHFESHATAAAVGRVLCAIDLGPQSSRILCWAWGASQSFGARMAVAHAAPAPAHAHDPAEERALRSSAAGALTKRLEQLKCALRVEAELMIEFDHPARAISGLARQWGADLVVLGRGASEDLIGRLRANAYDIIRQCPCPVVSV